MTTKNPTFIHLRTHSAYSLARGVIKIKKLVEHCVKQQIPAVALTDKGNLFGALEFSLEASKAGIQPIIGVEIQLAEHLPEHAHQQVQTGDLVLITQNKTGFNNLLKLVSASFVEGQDPQNPIITLAQLEGKTEGILALTGGANGLLAQYCANSHSSAANALLQQLQNFFPDRLYIELQRHRPATLSERNEFWPREQAVEAALIDLAYAHNLPLVATNDAYFLQREMFEAQDALVCIGTGRYVSEQERERYTPEHSFKSAQEMAELFADIPEAIANTVQIAQRCAVMAEGSKPMLPNFPTHAGRTQEEEFRAVATEGLAARLTRRGLSNEDCVSSEKPSSILNTQYAIPYVERLEYEINTIVQMGFAGYFLIVSDFIRWSKEQGIPVGPGRGSGAGSVVAWAMQITDLDPLHFGLLFERFLNPERVSMPDFDIDFCQDRRDEVIRYVQQKYGKDHVAQIITFGTLQARAVVRDVARVLQISYNQADQICKMIPANPANPVTLQQAIDMDAELRRMRDSDEQIRHLMDLALKLEGMYRHAGTHAAGLVIGSKPLDEILPLYADPRSPLPVTQYPMKYAEAAGLVKFDFLGLKTLTVIDNAVRLINANHQPPTTNHFDITTIPYNDPATFAMLAKGDSTGVFQMESAGMRDALRKMKPDTIEDIIALISLYRPGPMENIPTYIARKHGHEKPDYLHHSLEPCLKETYGVIIYQEQVMEIAKTLSGYSLGGADLLRRAMGKKIKEEMEQQRALFVDGAIKNNVDGDLAGGIFDLVEKFAGYGFNKSHAAAYAVIGYQTAYLKANYPVEFLTACMNIDLHDTDKLFLYCEEADRSDITVLPPDVNKSSGLFTVETNSSASKASKPEPALSSPEASGSSASKEASREQLKNIRYGLGGLKGVGLAAMEAMVEQRKEAGGTFRDPFHFARSVDARVLNKRQIESLAKAGAFDTIHPNRHQLHEATALLLKYGQTYAEEKASNQISLFGGGGNNSETPPPPLPNVAEWDENERLAMEREAIGFYLSSHPLDSYKQNLRQLGVTPYAALRDYAQTVIAAEGKINNVKRKVAGVMSSFKIRSSPKGRYAFLQLSDPSGVMEISLFNEGLINDKREIIQSGKPLLVEVDMRGDEGGLRLQAEAIGLLDDAIANQQHIAVLHLHKNCALATLKESITTLPQGRAQLRLNIPTAANMHVVVALPGRYTLTPQAIKQLQQVQGVLDVAIAG